MNENDIEQDDAQNEDDAQLVRAIHDNPVLVVIREGSIQGTRRF